eukprot:1150244-Pelagomonas_calceolata.AAC.2
MEECMGVLKGRPYPVPCLGETTEGTTLLRSFKQGNATDNFLTCALTRLFRRHLLLQLSCPCRQNWGWEWNWEWAGSGTKTGTRTGTGTRIGPRTGIKIGTSTGTRSGTGTRTGTSTEIGTGTRTGIGTRSGTGTGTGIGTRTGSQYLKLNNCCNSEGGANFSPQSVSVRFKSTSLPPSPARHAQQDAVLQNMKSTGTQLSALIPCFAHHVIRKAGEAECFL